MDEYGFVFYRCTKCDKAIVERKGLKMRQAISEHNLDHQRNDSVNEFWRELYEA